MHARVGLVIRLPLAPVDGSGANMWLAKLKLHSSLAL